MSDITPRKPRGAPRGLPFRKGQSGNPIGRRPGCLNKASVAAATLLDGEAGRLTRRAVELADAGDSMALKLCLERVVQFPLPKIERAADIAAAMGAVAAAVASGDLTPGEAEAFAQVVTTFMRAIETSDFDRRLQALETHAQS